MAVVSDSGPGVPAELQGSLFEPFVTTKGVAKGTGLGLYICERIATELGGEIRLLEGTEQGAQFEVRLPGLEE